jgi:hypothetical protein
MYNLPAYKIGSKRVHLRQCATAKSEAVGFCGFFSFLSINHSTRYSMSWCAGCLTWWGPLKRGDLLWVQSLLIEVLAPRKRGFYLESKSTNYPDHGHQGNPAPNKENPNGTAGNQTRDLVISSQKLWPLDHEAGRRLFDDKYDSRVKLLISTPCYDADEHNVHRHCTVPIDTVWVRSEIFPSKFSSLLLDAFVKLPYSIISCVMSVRLYGTTRLPLDGFSWNLIFEYFSKICGEN